MISELIVPAAWLTFKLLLIVLLAGLIGYERERIHRPAGLRTHIIVGIGALIVSILSVDHFPGDPARLLSGIVTGIGFLGAGTIFREDDLVRGLTTAASLWATAGVGIAVALGHYTVAILGSVLIYLVLDAKSYPIFRDLFVSSDPPKKRTRKSKKTKKR